MAKQKFIGMVTPNTLEIMIKYTLISSILNKICEMTTKPLEYPGDATLLEFDRNQNMGNRMETANWQNNWMGGMALGECKNWQRSFALLKEIINILKEDMEDYH